MHKTIQPADADKIAILAQHPKSLGTTGLKQHMMCDLLTN